METTKTATLHVLAGAYRGRDIGRRALLTHLVYLDKSGYPERSGCRQPVDNLDDITQDTANRPTCPTCSRKWDRLTAKK